MNLRIVARYLGVVCLLIGGFMVFSMPWAHPFWGTRGADASPAVGAMEWAGLRGLFFSGITCVAVALCCFWYAGRSREQLFRKEAMAVVGLSWALATVLGALPYLFAGCVRGPAVRMHGDNYATVHREPGVLQGPWQLKPLSAAAGEAVTQLLVGLPLDTDHVDQLIELQQSDPDWDRVLLMPGETGLDGRSDGIRVVQLRMDLADALFESQSGFSTTGATVISNLEDPRLVPHCILFWRSSTQFLGGLGIIVLFVVLLGQGSAGKALMRAELPGPTQDTSQARIQHVAWQFAALYAGLNLVLTVWLCLCGLSLFDALCHAFATTATGGFSTYNASIAHFNSAGIEWTLVLFMILASTNFTLLWNLLRGKFAVPFRDLEWRTYLLIIGIASLLVILFGVANGDFAQDGSEDNLGQQLGAALRYGVFQVVAVVTTTGFCTQDFDLWNDVARGLMLVLMFVGGCAGSTSGGMKVIRHILLAKILMQEVELSFRPNVVRPLRLGGQPVQAPDLRNDIMVYFGMIVAIFILSWLCLLLVESDTTWGPDASHQLIDGAGAVASMLNNVGPGVGTVSSTHNFGHFSWISKLLFTWLMMLGRVEIFVILCLFQPRFWRVS